MNLRTFLQQQNLTLLPNSASDWKVGYQFEWDRPILKIKPEVTAIYITNKIHPLISNEAIFSKAEQQQMEAAFDALNQKAEVDANLNTIDVDKSHDFKTLFTLPYYGIKVDGGFNYNVVKNFVVEGVSYKNMTGDAYALLQENMIALKRNDKKTFNQIDELAYIEQLWYASKFTVDIKQEYAGKLDVAWKVEGVGIEVDANVDGEGYKKLKINLKNTCPFAIKIKSLGDLAS